MKTLSLSTHWSRTSAWARGLALSALAAGAWALSVGLTQAHASDVYWSVGIQQPGVSVGVSSAPPVVVHSYPVVPYRPVVVVPQPVYVHSRGYGPRWDDRRDRHHQWHRRHDRHDRYDRHDGDGDDRRGGSRR